MSPSASDQRSAAAGDKKDRVRRSAPRLADMQEAEVSRVRTLHGGWRWALIVATAVDHPVVHQPAILAAVFHRLYPAQHRIFLSADRVDAAVHVPDLSGNGERAARPHSLVRRPALRADLRLRHLADAERPQGGGIRLGIRRRADERDRCRPRHVGRADGGAAAHRRLEPVAERAAVHGLSAVCRRQMARAVPRHAIDARTGHRLSRAVGRKPARHSDPGLRRHRDRLSGVRHRADDDGRRKILHQHRLCDVRHVPRRRREGLHLCLRPARHDVAARSSPTC